MINLLPAEEKQKLLSEKKRRLAIVLGITALISLFCFVLILLSIKFYILAETDFQKNILKQTQQEAETPDFASLSDSIQKYNEILAQVDSFYENEIYFNQALKIITDIPSPKNLHLTNFSLNREDSGNIQASVAGVSDTRDDLLAFKQNIENSKKIKNPYFSSESWISPKNVNFSLTFEINENQQ
ncbi:MAG: hypothetical protein NTY81_03255 [Candidatus Staskawiczbacteria bacterium]|nr:hypothetical protein [Candidatus Staskawiczbacteria bacterium]